MRKIKCILFSLILAISAGLFAQQPQMPPLPKDPKLRYGHLENGMTYYIRHNEEPKQRAEFFIVQKVGAILENDNQDGLAHFLEHMSFNGTQHFEGKGIINFLEKRGVKFGENINAYTSLDETVYNLSDVPTVNQGLVDSAMLVLHDWAHSLSLLDNEIDAERGVIREEWRTRTSNADMRMWIESNKLKYPGSQYAKRSIVGDTAVINNFKYQTLRDYYAKWYRPDLQGIIIVGDVDVDKIEAELKSMFADIPKPVNPAERTIYTVENNKEPIVAIVTDPEASRAVIEVEYKHDKMPAELKQSAAGYGMNVINQLISGILAERFEEITKQPTAPFVMAFSEYGEMVKSKDHFDLAAIPKEGKEFDALKALLTEAEKIKRFGFTPSELERAKTNLLKNYEKAFNEKDNQKNESFVDEYKRNFLSDEPIPGIEMEYNMVKAMMPGIKADVINQVVKEYVTDENMIITLTAPKKDAVKVPTKEEVIASILDIKNAKLEAKKDEAMNKPLMEKKPIAGTVLKVTKNPAMDATEMLLSNGVKVIFKPTTFKKDEILLSAFSDGGLSKVHNAADLPSATLAAGIVENNGIANFSQTDLSKILTGKIANVSPYISAYEEGLKGNSSVVDLETMLQLTYLYFTAPRKDNDAYESMINMYRTTLANSAKNPNKAFNDSIQKTITNHDPRTVLYTLDMIKNVNQDKALAIYKQRFANAADFTFVLVGNIDPQNKATQKLLATYLGGLKTTKVKEKWDDVNLRSPKGKVNNYFEREMEVKKASNFIYYSANIPYTLQNNIVMDAIGNILFTRYLESIREKEGGSYGVGVRGALNNTPANKAILLMQFDTDPEKQVKLMGIIHGEVQEIVKNGPKADDLNKVKENLLKQYAQDVAQNSWWKDKLKTYYKDKLNYKTDYKAAVEALTPEFIQKTLKSVVDQGNVIEVVMKPTK